MLTALVLSSFAYATDVGVIKKFGIGIATGPMGISATGKYYLNQKMGISAYIGSSVQYQGLRANFEMEFLEPADWDFARLGLYWDAGVDLGIWTWYGLNAGIVGVGGGVGAELQFHEVPASVFVDVGIGLYPVNAYDELKEIAGFGLIAPRGAAGGRWYF